MISAIFLLALIVSTSIQQVSGYGEPFTTPSQAVGHPVYQERANFHLINVVRVDPTNYKAIYMNGYSPSPASILQTSNYPPVAPLYMEPRLFASAYNHSLDMTTHNCFQHPTCVTNEDPFVRIGHFYSCSGGEAENIAAGYSDPLQTSNQWLCDETSASVCATDKATDDSDGHRADIMGPYQSAGVGYSVNTADTYKYYWTQDFGGACTGQTSPIYSGTHLISGSTTKFGALFYSTTLTPSSASVVISGTSYALTKELGAIGNGGNYAYSGTKGSACRSYYFTFVAGGTTYRFPDTGCLVTYNEGTCTTSFDAGCSGGTVAPTTAPTAGPATPAPTLAPTKAPTPAPTQAPTIAPTKAPTKAPTTAPGAPTPAPTTAPTKAPTTAPTKAPTAAPTTAPTGDQYLYQNGALANTWTTYDNNAADVTASYSLSGVTCLKAVLESTSTSNYFFWFQRPSETNTWTSVVITYQASAPFYVFWNVGGSNPAASVAAASTWTTTTISFTTITSPASIGAVELTFYNPSSSASTTLYLRSVNLH